MTTIATNFKVVGAKFLLMLLLCTACYFIIIIAKEDGSIRDSKWVLYFISVLLIYLIIGLTISFLGVIKVEIDKSIDQLVFITILSRKTINKEDIAGYYKSLYNHTRYSKAKCGRIIQFQNNTSKELNPSNLIDIEKLDDYFNYFNIPYLGEKKSTYPFTKTL